MDQVLIITDYFICGNFIYRPIKKKSNPQSLKTKPERISQISFHPRPLLFASTWRVVPTRTLSGSPQDSQGQHRGFEDSYSTCALSSGPMISFRLFRICPLFLSSSLGHLQLKNAKSQYPVQSLSLEYDMEEKEI